MLRLVLSFIALMALWLLLSGLYKPLIVGFGVLSVLVVVWVGHRMDRADGDRVQVPIRPLRAVNYTIWLFGEIAKANWAVTKVILSPRMPIRQHIFVTPYTQYSDLGQVVFANSITLTPGTITVETQNNSFLVHALAYDEGDHAALADMDRRVSAIESKRVL